MKSTLFSVPRTFAGVGLLIILFAARTYGGLAIPYSVDADTLHLWHFNGPTNTVATTDEVQTASITLTNFSGLGTTVTLGNASAIGGLATAMQIIPPSLTSGSANGFALNGTFWPDTTPFRNPTSGAFTMEAVVRCTGNPYVANGNWEIIAGDNSPGAGQSRGWQFRIQSGASPQINFNFITGGGGNYTFNLPKSGPNVLLQGIWYHVAVTYTGNAPTNTDTAGILTFYWTVLDGGRTAASFLTNVVTAGTFTLGGTPVLGVGGSARNPGTPANGEGFKGLIDEVRLSGICRTSNDMAFAVGGAATPPAFLQQPPTNTLIGFGQTLSLPTLVAGAPDYYWYHDGTLLPSQTDSSLVIPNVAFADGGGYQLIASNSLGMATSLLAQVTIGAAFSELFDTGVDANHDLAAANSVDLHYFLYRSSDLVRLGPDTIIWDMTTYPIAASGGNFSNPDGVSAWLGPQANNYTSPVGDYRYRTYFLLDSVDLTQPVTLSGIWYVNEFGSDILLNGLSTGFSNSAANSSAGKFPANFTITNKFVAGLNTLEFVTTRSPAANGSYLESALRVEMSGIGRALVAGVPVITNQPANVTVREGGRASYSVVARGRPPLTYQWYADSSLLSGATNRTLAFNPVTTGAQGTNFFVVISNTSGSVTSQVATLTLTTNRPPVAPSITVGTYSNAPVSVSIADLFYATTDADLDPLTVASVDSVSTNGGTITQTGVIATYMPTLDYLGADQFSYAVTDSVEVSSGFINILVNPLLSPTISSTTRSGSSLILGISGGGGGGSYRILSSTNLLVPLASWTPLATNVFSLSGNASFTNTIIPGAPQRFYIIQVP